MCNYKKCKNCGNEKEYSSLWYCNKCEKIKIEQCRRNGIIRANKRDKELRAKNNPFMGIKRRLINRIALKKTWDNNKNYRIAMRLRSLLYGSLKAYTPYGKKMTSKKYGIDFNKIIEHLKPFPKDISKYHIDHIYPLSRFNLSDTEQVKKAFAPENHQWLLASDNIRKGNKI